MTRTLEELEIHWDGRIIIPVSKQWAEYLKKKVWRGSIHKAIHDTWPIVGQTETMRLNMEFLGLVGIHDDISWELHRLIPGSMRVKPIHRKQSEVMILGATTEPWIKLYGQADSLMHFYVMYSNEDFLLLLPLLPLHHHLHGHHHHHHHHCHHHHHQGMYRWGFCYLKHY